MKGAAKHRWIDASWKDIIRVIDDKKEGGFYAACFQFNIGVIALRKALTERGYGKHYGFRVPASICVDSKPISALSKKVADLEAENELYRIEIQAMKNMRVVMSQNGDGLHIVVKEG